MSTTLAEGRGLVLAYGATTAVAASDFTIPQGGVTAIIGPNGSGKSTLLHALAGINEPKSGVLTVFGADTSQAWRKVAYVMQSLAFPEGTPITVREVVAMGRYPNYGWFGRPRKADRERVQFAMKLLDVEHLAKRHLGELSGGQRQRVYVAQGIAQDHEALLLDEPLTGLDLVSAKTIDTIIHSERDRGHSVVLTTHDLAEANAADHVILMSGRVVASGPPAEVLTRSNLETAYGLGSLHEPGDDFLDDPGHSEGHDPTDSGVVERKPSRHRHTH